MTPKTCYGYVDVLRNFFGVLITEEDQSLTCTMFNVFCFIFTYRFGFSFTIRLGGRLTSVTPPIKSVHDLRCKPAYQRLLFSFSRLKFLFLKFLVVVLVL